MESVNRRKFLKVSGMGIIPAVVPVTGLMAAGKSIDKIDKITAKEPMIEFYSDGRMFNAADTIEHLQTINAAAPIRRDSYGNGGAVAALEKKFQEITGKEKSIFLPTGTLANQLAISVLSGSDTKVFVQETSHVYRDEADAAQSVFGKRLIPLAKGETYFTAMQLEEAVQYHDREEVFKSGMGCVSIENPVRRTDGGMIPLSELKAIRAYCKKTNLRMHLDGARIFMASAWSGVSVKDYAAEFDTIYISLYKYLGAAGGAVLSGPESVISKIPHLMKIHGGTMYGNWANAAMALDRVQGIEERLQKAIKQATELFARLNQLPGINISPLKGGTNIYKMTVGKSVAGEKLFKTLAESSNILMPFSAGEPYSLITVNETLLVRDNDFIVNAFKAALGNK